MKKIIFFLATLCLLGILSSCNKLSASDEELEFITVSEEQIEKEDFCRAYGGPSYDQNFIGYSKISSTLRLSHTIPIYFHDDFEPVNVNKSGEIADKAEVIYLSNIDRYFVLYAGRDDDAFLIQATKGKIFIDSSVVNGQLFYYPPKPSLGIIGGGEHQGIYVEVFPNYSPITGLTSKTFPTPLSCEGRYFYFALPVFTS